MEYSKYRNIGKYLNDDILEYLHDTQKPINDLKLLKIIKGNEIQLYTEDEQDLCYDFILYEKTLNKKSGIDIYLENNDVEDEEELKLINAMKNSYTALYRAIGVDKSGCSVLLENIDTGERTGIIDIGLSKSLNEECLIFTRLIKLENINFTSGMSMVFNTNHEEFLKRVLKKEIRKSNLDSDIQRFISYFYLSRKHGHSIYRMGIV
ncbi:MAG: hypothetical protein ACRCXT_02485 [Paraclostridium sp.]